MATAQLRIGLEILQLTTLQAGRSAIGWLLAGIDHMGYVSKLDIALQYSIEMVKECRKPMVLMRFMRHIHDHPYMMYKI